MKRYRLGRRKSARSFARGARRVKKLNLGATVSRGGIRL